MELVHNFRQYDLHVITVLSEVRKMNTQWKGRTLSAHVSYRELRSELQAHLILLVCN